MFNAVADTQNCSGIFVIFRIFILGQPARTGEKVILGIVNRVLLYIEEKVFRRNVIVHQPGFIVKIKDFLMSGVIYRLV